MGMTARKREAGQKKTSSHPQEQCGATHVTANVNIWFWKGGTQKEREMYRFPHVFVIQTRRHCLLSCIGCSPSGLVDECHQTCVRWGELDVLGGLVVYLVVNEYVLPMPSLWGAAKRVSCACDLFCQISKKGSSEIYLFFLHLQKVCLRNEGYGHMPKSGSMRRSLLADAATHEAELAAAVPAAPRPPNCARPTAGPSALPLNPSPSRLRSSLQEALDRPTPRPRPLLRRPRLRPLPPLDRSLCWPPVLAPLPPEEVWRLRLL